MTQKIALLLAEGFEEAEALVPTDLFRRAGLAVDLISIEPTETVRGAHQVQVVADTQIGRIDFSQYDVIMLPGGKVDPEKYVALSDTLNAFVAAGKRIVSICAAPTVLAQLGLLKGKNAVCYPSMRSAFDEYDVHYHHVPAVVDGIFVTGRGPGAAFDFALTVIGELLGVDAVETLKQQIFY